MSSTFRWSLQPLPSEDVPAMRPRTQRNTKIEQTEGGRRVRDDDGSVGDGDEKGVE